MDVKKGKFYVVKITEDEKADLVCEYSLLAKLSDNFMTTVKTIFKVLYVMSCVVCPPMILLLPAMRTKDII